MKRSSMKWQVMGLFLMIGCGGADTDRSSMPRATPPDQQPASTPTTQQEEPYTPAPTAGVTTPSEAGMPAPGESAAPQATPPTLTPAPKPEPPTLRAAADLKMIKGGASVGTITFEERDGQVIIAGRFSGLPPGPHGFHIHEKGSCANKGKAAGEHLNPTKAKHGPPESATRHAGDFGNLTVDKEGNASFEMTTDSLTVKPGADSVTNRAIIIHAKKDDGKTQPSGGSGMVLACGVIQGEAAAPTAP